MSAPSSTLELRERAVLAVLDLAVRFVSSHHRRYAALAAWILVPGLLLSELAGAFVGERTGWTIAIVLGLFAQIPFTLLASRLVFEPQVALRTILAKSVAAFGRVLAVRLIQSALVAIAGLFMVVPALWPASTLLFMPEVVILEESGAIDATSRANDIGSQRRGETVLAVLLLVSLELVFVVLAELAGRALVVDVLQISPVALADAGGHPLALVCFWLFVPYRATARFLLYLNVRTREEGWDVQTRFAALAARWRAEANGHGETRGAA